LAKAIVEPVIDGQQPGRAAVQPTGEPQRPECEKLAAHGIVFDAQRLEWPGELDRVGTDRVAGSDAVDA
jgi:hypothetical protein